MARRFHNKYTAFIDGMYVHDVCDTNDIYHFVEICQIYNYLPNFFAYANGKRIDTIFFIYIDAEEEEELERLEELLDYMTL